MVTTANLERVKMARESRGLNQSELNEITGLPITTINKIERQDLRLSAEALSLIAQHTRYPLSFFEAPGQPAPDTLAWRRREKVPQKLISTIAARVNIMRLHVQQLTTELKIQAPLLPNLQLSESFRPADAARYLREVWQLPDAPIANLTLTLETQGIPVAAFHFGTDRVDSRATITDDHYPLICVNSNQPGDRQRFSLAYQLGHLLLHIYKPVLPTQDTSREANQFAAELLMPETRFRAEVGSDAITLPLLSNMKRSWGVSMIALLYRGCDLGYVTDDQKSNLLQQFNRMGLRRREPIELDVPAEEPRLIRSWLIALKKKHRLSMASLAARLHLSPEELDEVFGLREFMQRSGVK
jgi:Zn-dependent peptidase ImmA (M78 family)/DNA-binding XRE family transcriptional regulator